VTEASKSTVYETVLGSIDTNFQAKIFHDPALRLIGSFLQTTNAVH
jgi:hypothetical protein